MLVLHCTPAIRGNLVIFHFLNENNFPEFEALHVITPSASSGCTYSFNWKYQFEVCIYVMYILIDNKSQNINWNQESSPPYSSGIEESTEFT